VLKLHYGVIVEQHGDKSTLIYSYPESFEYDIDHDDIFERQPQSEEHFDLSDSKSIKHKQNLVKFKNEMHYQEMAEAF
jgi:hypothetical protein